MKRFIYFSLILLSLSACSPDTTIVFNISEHEFHFEASGGDREITVTSNQMTVTIDKYPDWITVIEKEKKKAKENMIYVFLLTASENDSVSSRESTFRVTDSTISTHITVTQAGKNN
ncbi:MAG: BACON domain-containing protein [Tannerella sp.]|jgi:hypothetical protein|nr:BACON domain-containing protein [Tannerella sp.]